MYRCSYSLYKCTNTKDSLARWLFKCTKDSLARWLYKCTNSKDSPARWNARWQAHPGQGTLASPRPGRPRTCALAAPLSVLSRRHSGLAPRARIARGRRTRMSSSDASQCRWCISNSGTLKVALAAHDHANDGWPERPAWDPGMPPVPGGLSLRICNTVTTPTTMMAAASRSGGASAARRRADVVAALCFHSSA